MKKFVKPAVRVVEMTSSGIICASGYATDDKGWISSEDPDYNSEHKGWNNPHNPHNPHKSSIFE